MSEALRHWTAGGATLAYAALCAAIYARQRHRAKARAAAAVDLAGTADSPVLVLHATQTGLAEQWAWATAEALHRSGTPARVLALNALDADLLAGTLRALFIASTYGEGDAPDGASAFADAVMHRPAALAHLRYAVLALGDRQYSEFCGFGRRLDAWLQAAGATPEFARIDVDRGDPEALQRWHEHLGLVAPAASAGAETAFHAWTLRQREHLNPGSLGGPIHRLHLQAPAGMAPHWEAGDLVDLHLDSDPARPRAYSICSIPEEGDLQLMVRQTRHPNGRPGAASGLLTETLQPGQSVPLRLRPHPGFRLHPDAQRPLLLIGNGTGLAGLRALLRERIRRGQHENWLVFGERQRAHDRLLDDELTAWQAAGRLARLDWVFSRDGDDVAYVQHRLLHEAAQVSAWCERGAVVHVCGSLQGMAAAVDLALRQILGEPAMQRLQREGRYRRDVY
ncbi:sulfite reductase subunit alpha [Pseudacidovorax intermedius]|uniref:sulfite reductase subunit alpha n=1 Tax=Pseudacidovorax intermedius TaxID=433924 RepID=UPI0003462F67|nr:sulfite reductase subunit alpha [Pseudacidovorax intermedius]